MSIVIPNEIIKATGKSEKLLQLELAIIMFRDYQISSAKAANFANLSLIEFRQELGKRNICVNYDSSDFQQELQTLKILSEL
ncbi:MAG: UPF0175 family protein [Okeania sp. SIO3I5]|uniref:UPF0175 family protein n=1 Tax=Okeania sp. SIO3I5 TaxID=2607805 RepID=UPI0013B687F9|nr:UPF0175 family protein [Okeania sp. SIO3I5]NEQ40982.1 UPF0175 family protein [Okeania sp. SIO3I5]